MPRPILQAGAPVLRQKAKKIKEFGQQVASLTEEMLESMHAAEGLGLAAPQIGVSQRVIVIQMPGETDEEGQETEPGELYIYCNPEIIEASGEEEGPEGCLSVLGYVGEVKRATQVTVKGQDVNGRKIRTKATGLLARAFQHEIDHLDGILYIDHIDSPEKLKRIGEDETTEAGLSE